MACAFCVSGEIWEAIGFDQACPNCGITYEEWHAEIDEGEVGDEVAEEGKDEQDAWSE